MFTAKSHWRLRTTAVLTASVIVPVSLALGGAFLVGQQAIRFLDERSEQFKANEVRSQSKLLSETVWDGIDNVKVRALAFESMHGKGIDMDPMIHSISEIEVDSTGRPMSVRNTIINSGWTTDATKLRANLQIAAKNVSLQRIRDSGASVVPMEQMGNQLGIAFSGKGSRPLLVTVTPTEVFKSFSRWATRREAGNLRGFLIGADGRVLVHSEWTYSGADFSSTEIFRQALRPAFTGNRSGGIATFRAVDYRPVLASYVQLRGLPLAVVVERVVQPSMVGSGLAMRVVSIPAVLLILTCLFISVFSVLIAQRFLPAPAQESWAITGTEIENALQQILQAQELREQKTDLAAEAFEDFLKPEQENDSKNPRELN